MIPLVETLQDNIQKRRKISKNKKLLENFVGENCGFTFDPFATKYFSNNYVIKHASRNEEICGLVQEGGEKKIKENLYSKLAGIPHTYRISHGIFSLYPYSEKPENVQALHPSQLLRTWILMKSLEKQGFIDDIGELIEKALRDPYSEHGGLILFEDTSLTLRNIESTLAKKKDPKYKDAYIMPFKARKIPNVARYHFHAAMDDCSEYAGPSGGFLFLGGDLAAAHGEAIFNNESHGVVMTKLKGQNFNVDYYSFRAVVEEGADGKGKVINHPLVVLDLGNYEYGK